MHNVPRQNLELQQDTLPADLIVIDTIHIQDKKDCKRSALVVTQSTALKDYISHMKFSGETVLRKDTTTTFNFDKYEERIEVKFVTYPVEIEDMIYKLDFSIRDLLIELANEEMTRQIGN